MHCGAFLTFMKHVGIEVLVALGSLIRFLTEKGLKWAKKVLNKPKFPRYHTNAHLCYLSTCKRAFSQAFFDIRDSGLMQTIERV